MERFYRGAPGMQVVVRGDKVVRYGEVVRARRLPRRRLSGRRARVQAGALTEAGDERQEDGADLLVAVQRRFSAPLRYRLSRIIASVAPSSAEAMATVARHGAERPVALAAVDEDADEILELEESLGEGDLRSPSADTPPLEEHQVSDVGVPPERFTDRMQHCGERLAGVGGSHDDALNMGVEGPVQLSLKIASSNPALLLKYRTSWDSEVPASFEIAAVEVCSNPNWAKRTFPASIRRIRDV